jgi:UDP-GlcNAc:undecaprenyl-phosphate GlcNAc-1-phosphate transferase
MSISPSQLLTVGLLAFVLTGFSTWPIRNLAIRLGAMDAPNIPRKTQSTAIPFLGGLSIALGITVSILVAVFIGSQGVDKNPSELWNLALTTLVPALLLGGMGLIDDFRSLPPLPRLITQTIVGSGVAFIIIKNGTVGAPFGNWDKLDYKWINWAVTIFWIVAVCNSINFFDNLDGAASGTVAISSFGVFFIAYNHGQELISALSIVVTGSTLAFLIWNKPPAKIYMGDGGALFLGVIISVSTIRLDPGLEPFWTSLFIPLMLLGIPILDTSVVILSRISKGVSPLTGGMDHLSHRLQRAGCSKSYAVVVLWTLSAFSSMAAIGVNFLDPAYKPLLIVFYVFLWISLFWLFLRKWF